MTSEEFRKRFRNSLISIREDSEDFFDYETYSSVLCSLMKFNIEISQEISPQENRELFRKEEALK